MLGPSGSVQLQTKPCIHCWLGPILKLHKGPGERKYRGRRHGGAQTLWVRNGSERGTITSPAGIGTGVKALLRPEDVAEALAVSKVTVYRLARSGELASIRIRGQVRFRPEAVEDYLSKAGPGRHQPPAPQPAPPRRGRPRKQWVPSDAA